MISPINLSEIGEDVLDPGTARAYQTTHLTTSADSDVARTWIGPGTREDLKHSIF
jgi:hypothetical protein